MSDAADVRSIEAVRDLHAGVCRFRKEAADAIVSTDIVARRANDWLAERFQYWQRAKREAEDEVVHARSALARKQYVLPGFRKPDTSVEEEDLKRALAKVKYAEEKMDRVRKWMAKLPREIGACYEGPARQLAALLEGELPRGLALLERRIVALEQYIGTKAPTSEPLPPTATGADAPEEPT